MADALAAAARLLRSARSRFGPVDLGARFWNYERARNHREYREATAARKFLSGVG